MSGLEYKKCMLSGMLNAGFTHEHTLGLHQACKVSSEGGETTVPGHNRVISTTFPAYGGYKYGRQRLLSLAAIPSLVRVPRPLLRSSSNNLFLAFTWPTATYARMQFLESEKSKLDAIRVAVILKKQLDIEKELNRRRVLVGDITDKAHAHAKPWHLHGAAKGHLGTMANAHFSDDEAEDEAKNMCASKVDMFQCLGCANKWKTRKNCVISNG